MTFRRTELAAYRRTYVLYQRHCSKASNAPAQRPCPRMSDVQFYCSTEGIRTSQRRCGRSAGSRGAGDLSTAKSAHNMQSWDAWGVYGIHSRPAQSRPGQSLGALRDDCRLRVTGVTQTWARRSMHNERESGGGLHPAARLDCPQSPKHSCGVVSIFAISSGKCRPSGAAPAARLSASNYSIFLSWYSLHLVQHTVIFSPICRTCSPVANTNGSLGQSSSQWCMCGAFDVG